MKLLYLLLALPVAWGDRVVQTYNGPVKGKSLTPLKVEAFLGIPYAEPPVGPLRFAKPLPKSSWEETYDATELPPSCIQYVLKELAALLPGYNTKMTENCLYLNLWVPMGGSDVKPVMLFIHGGGFMMGSSNAKLIDGAKLSEQGDVIVASINYRVGSLGFFSGSVEEAAGNMGMYDQVMAIQWVKDNAKHFGGDPNNIVLFGESAGAFSVSLHTVSSLSKNLFKRGILQSGSALHPMYSDLETHSKDCQVIARLAGCADDDEALKKNPKNVVECLKNLPAEKFSEVDLLFHQQNGMLNPIVGDDFLPEDPIELIKKGEFKESELLTGVTRNEGSLLLGFMKSDVFGMFLEKVTPNDFNETFAREIMKDLVKLDADSEIIQSYIDRVKTESRYTYFHAMADLLGDFLITCGAVFEADYKALKNNPVYFYLFDYRSPTSPFPEWAGVIHAAELPYVFGNPMFLEFSDYEKELSKDMMEMWVAFAKTGNPNIPGELEWPRYTHEDGKHFIIGQRDRVGVRPDNNRCEIWRSFFRSKID